MNNNSIGFGKQALLDSSKILDSLKETFRPEFLNRIDEIVVFNSLTKEQLLKIIDLMLEDTKKALSEKNITLEVSLKAKEYLLDKGTDLKYGARPLRRAIQKYIEDEISEKILRQEIINGNNIKVDLRNKELTFEK